MVATVAVNHDDTNHVEPIIQSQTQDIIVNLKQKEKIVDNFLDNILSFRTDISQVTVKPDTPQPSDTSLSQSSLKLPASESQSTSLQLDVKEDTKSKKEKLNAMIAEDIKSKEHIVDEFLDSILIDNFLESVLITEAEPTNSESAQTNFIPSNLSPFQADSPALKAM